MHHQQTQPSRARRLDAPRNGRRKGLFGTNYPMIFHEQALADLDALALDDEARELCLAANSSGSPKEDRGACFASASGSEPDGGSGARDGRHAVVGEVIGGRQPLRPGEATAAIEGATSIEDRLHAYARSFRACSRSTVGQTLSRFCNRVERAASPTQAAWLLLTRSSHRDGDHDAAARNCFRTEPATPALPCRARPHAAGITCPSPKDVMC
jgi:hypothetical protein